MKSNEIYLSNLEWTKTHDNIGGVMCNLIFKDNMSYEDYQKLLKNGYFVLCDKDYITNLQEENKRLKENAIHNDKVVDKAKWNEMIYKSRNEKAIEYIGNGNLGIPRKTRNKFIAILKGKDYNKVERAYLDDEWIGEDKDER